MPITLTPLSIGVRFMTVNPGGDCRQSFGLRRGGRPAGRCIVHQLHREPGSISSGTTTRAGIPWPRR